MKWRACSILKASSIRRASGKSDAHVAECPACRELLRVLEHESNLLTSALTEDTEPMPARLLGERTRNVPSWAWTLAFGAFAAGAYWLWTDGIGPWLDQLTNAGFGGTDLLSVILFSGAFWEGWGDMLDILQIVLLIIGVVGALVLLRRRLRMRRPAAIAVVVAALLVAVALPQPVAAADVRRGRSVFVPSTETVHNDLIVAGPSVRVDGTVERRSDRVYPRPDRHGPHHGRYHRVFRAGSNGWDRGRQLPRVCEYSYAWRGPSRRTSRRSRALDLTSKKPKSTAG